jgi:hypothetical protein
VSGLGGSIAELTPVGEDYRTRVKGGSCADTIGAEGRWQRVRRGVVSSVQCTVVINSVQNGWNVSCSERTPRCLLGSARTRLHERGTEVVWRVSGLTMYASLGWSGLACTGGTGTDRHDTAVVATSMTSTARLLWNRACLGSMRVAERVDRTCPWRDLWIWGACCCTDLNRSGHRERERKMEG